MLAHTGPALVWAHRMVDTMALLPGLTDGRLPLRKGQFVQWLQSFLENILMSMISSCEVSCMDSLSQHTEYLWNNPGSMRGVVGAGSCILLGGAEAATRVSTGLSVG